jgi:hypothetical protein
MILDKLNLFYFLVAFATGLFFCYITNPPPQFVLKFPSPTNAGKVKYTDKLGQCYVYKVNKSVCPTDKGKVLPQPILEDFKAKKSLKTNTFI